MFLKLEIQFNIDEQSCKYYKIYKYTEIFSYNL